MKKFAVILFVILLGGMLLAVGCKKEEKAEPSKKEAAPKKDMSEPAPVPPGTPKY